MMGALDFLTTWILMLAAAVTGQKLQSSRQNSGLQLECLGSIMRLSLDQTLAVGNLLEIDAINGTDLIPLTPSLAAQCGHSMESDPWGNTKIYSSLLGCYVDNQADMTFNIGLQLRMYGNPQLVQDTYNATKTCSYNSWATREILCDRNYMEVSTRVVRPEVPVQTVASLEVQGLQDDSWKDSWKDAIGDVPVDSKHTPEVLKVMFFTPELKVMLLEEAQRAGYGLRLTPTRVVMRSPVNTAETYSEEVAGVPMEVFSVATYHMLFYGAHVVESKAACPTGGVLFTEDVITWHVPRRITPMIDGPVKILEMHMGIDGQKLDRTQMDARHYSLSATESHIIVELPVGSPDGYYKSHAPDYQYHITFTIEPMLEMLWREEKTRIDSRYKVLFPITTPLMPRPPQVADDTVPEQRLFDVLLGTFLHDVELVNITFSTGVLSVAECNARGFNVQEHISPDGLKTFSMTVPFSDKVVLKRNPEVLVTVYSLPLIYGLLIQPEQTPFPHTAELEVSLQDVVLPSLTGTCDQANFHVTVKYGNQAPNFKTKVGYGDLTRDLTPELAKEYGLTENGTHFSLVIPYTSADSAFELVQDMLVRARFDLLLWDPINYRKVNDFSLSCNFPIITTECYSNGTMMARALKMESVPKMIPSQLTLRDRSCKPDFSNEHFAFFSFHVDACGTTRMFEDDLMVYENEISLSHDPGTKKPQGTRKSLEPQYRHTIYCIYQINDTETMVFHSRPRDTEPTAEPGRGELVVQIRLAQGASYGLFYQAEDYPVIKYLRQPLYFEVELMQSIDPQIELVLENCWATLHDNRTSLPSWDLILNSCENRDDRYLTQFHPVVADARVHIAAHVKRFSMTMFTFTSDEVVLKDQIFIHCDAVICDSNASDGICSGQCVSSTKTSGKPLRTAPKRGHRSAVSKLQEGEFSSVQISSGLILFV